MAKLTWDKVGERRFETGVNKGVLYIPDTNGVYATGVAWNGLTTVTESPSGAEATPLYADNIKYLNLISAEDFGATIEAYTCPNEFYQFDGVSEPATGVYVGQQSRRSFGLSYQTRIGNDVKGQDLGYKIHLIYGATAAPSERAYATINDTPEAMTLSWELTTSPVTADTAGTMKPTAQLTIDSTRVSAGALTTLENLLYGTAGTSPRLPLPQEVFDIFNAASIQVTTTAPTYTAATDIITIPSTVGVIYSVNGNDVPAGAYGPITTDTVVQARPAVGYRFSATSDNDWTIVFS